ncbi:TSNAX protein, partial [Polypterus senegalus]|nr:TSNAX protein [Polypterus senegalus]
MTSVPDAEVLKESECKLDGIRLKIKQIAKELIGEDLYQYHRAFTPGIIFVQSCYIYSFA